MKYVCSLMIMFCRSLGLVHQIRYLLYLSVSFFSLSVSLVTLSQYSLSISIFQFVFLLCSVSFCLSLSLPLYLSLSFSHCVCLSISFSLTMCVGISLSLSFSLPFSLSLSLSLSISLSLSCASNQISSWIFNGLLHCVCVLNTQKINNNKRENRILCNFRVANQYKYHKRISIDAWNYEIKQISFIPPFLFIKLK